MNTHITTYYNQLAQTYDSDRFGHTYGRFLHAQERALLTCWLASVKAGSVLDLGCGTGRFLDLATHGLDASTGMLEVARQKFPEKTLQNGLALAMPLAEESFDAIFSMHMVMHLSADELQPLLAEAHRVLKPGGSLMFDFPSKSRRQLLGYKAAGWHGANAYTLQEIHAASAGQWRLEAASGFLFLPIHRVPRFMRSWLMGIDTWLCGSFMKRFSSYLIVHLIKI
ncbi:MAG: methyltransferase domain-containing protein [Saprospiraceae bacterium]|nr:methyltransferase domain-containing protein [Saprospiraceae bacterium]